MARQNRVDFERRDLLAAAVDDFLDAAGEVEPAGAVAVAEVAGPKPAVAEGRLVDLGLGLVGLNHPGATHPDLAQCVARYVLAGRPDQPQVEARRAADGAGRRRLADRNAGD